MELLHADSGETVRAEPFEAIEIEVSASFARDGERTPFSGRFDSQTIVADYVRRVGGTIKTSLPTTSGEWGALLTTTSIAAPRVGAGPDPHTERPSSRGGH